jgi:hypothetical protein
MQEPQHPESRAGSIVLPAGIANAVLASAPATDRLTTGFDIGMYIPNDRDR